MASILKVLLTPLCLTLIALALALILNRVKPVLSKSLVLLGFLFIFIFSLPIVSQPLVSHWESKIHDIPIAEISPSGTIILLSGGVVAPAGKRKTSELGASGDRLFAAFKLLDRHKNLNIWIADATVGCTTCRVEQSHSAKILQLWGVTPSRIFVAPSTDNTNAELLSFSRTNSNSAELPLIVVTSALHMPRTQLLLRKHDLQASPFSANHIVGDLNVLPHSLIPSVATLISSTRSLTEIVAYLYTLHFKV